MTQGSAPAGWYPDPQQPDHPRYWNGSEWGPSMSSTNPVRTSPPVQRAPQQYVGFQPGYARQRAEVVVKEKRGCLSSIFKVVWLII